MYPMIRTGPVTGVTDYGGGKRRGGNSYLSDLTSAVRDDAGIPSARFSRLRRGGPHRRRCTNRRTTVMHVFTHPLDYIVLGVLIACMLLAAAKALPRGGK